MNAVLADQSTEEYIRRLIRHLSIHQESRHIRDNEEDMRRPFPRGIEQSSLLRSLPNHPDILGELASRVGVESKVIEECKDLISMEFLLEFFDAGEAAQYVHEHGCWDCRRRIEKTDPLNCLFWKINNSSWRWEFEVIEWPGIVAFYQFFRQFHFGDGFEVTIDYTLGCNERGPGWISRKTDGCRYISESMTYLDGVFGLFIWKDGKHVMTIGVSPCASGLLVHQIQLKESKGNRWLFKLPCPHFEYTLTRLMDACEPLGIPVFLMDGQRAVDKLYESHVAEERDEFMANYGTRLKAFYDQPLTTLRRRRGAMFRGLARRLNRVA